MKDIYETHLNLKAKKVSCLELVQESVNAAKKSQNNTFITLTEELALEKAKKLDEERNSKKFASYIEGIPYTLKDLFITKNIRTTAGSKTLYNYIPPYQGYMAERLENDKGILIGKVGCDEFGMGSTNENTIFGPITNPLNREKVAGGSSGGSAASVSEGSSMFSMGTDTGGSVRLPANFCGLVGLKPTYGRVSRYGQIAYASSLDQASPLAKTVTDMACVLSSITKHDDRDSTNAPLGQLDLVDEIVATKASFLKGKKIGLSPSFVESCDPLVKKSLNAALDVFKENGAELIEVDLDNLKYSISTYYLIATSEASSNLARYDGIHFGYRAGSSQSLEESYIESRSQGFGDEVKRRILLGTFSLSSGYYDAYYQKACKIRRLIANDFKKAHEKCDVVFSPVCTSTAFKLGQGASDTFQMYMNDLYTIPANLAGLPGLAIPYGKGESEMPTGFQMIAPAFSEDLLLKLGKAFEEATNE